MSENSKNQNEPMKKRKSFPRAYTGDKPYIFVSFAHADLDSVLPEIERFTKAGYYVWYDECVIPDSERADEIATAPEGCSLFTVFLSKNSAASQNVRDEIQFALNEKLPVIPVYLEECSLPDELENALPKDNAVRKYKLSGSEYKKKIFEAFLNQGLEPDYEELSQRKSIFRRDIIISCVAIFMLASFILGSAMILPAVVWTDSNPSMIYHNDKGRFYRMLKAEPTPYYSFVFSDNEGEENTLIGYEGDETEVVIPDTVTSIGKNAFEGTDIVSVVIPDSVRNIGSGAFKDCATLQSVYMGNNVESIGDEAFQGDRKLARVRLSPKLGLIRKYCFNGCISLERIIIPDSVCKIEDCAFKHSGLRETVIGSGVEGIETEAFCECEYLNRIEIPGSVKELGERAFYDCFSLENVNLSEGLETIDSKVFSGTKAYAPIKELTIPLTVTSIVDQLVSTDTTVNVHKGSYGEQYAKEQKTKNYKIID